MASERSGKVAKGALIAAGIGYAIGILTAPKSGRETRRSIHLAATRAKTEAERNLKNLHSDLSKLISRGKRDAADMTAKAKDELDEAIVKAGRAKDKARQLLSAIHEGEADDKDLQKAADEVKNAISHLKSFMASDVKAKSEE